MGKLYYSKVIVDGRCLDLLLSEDEIEVAAERALDNPETVVSFPESHGNCWSAEKPPKCSLWSRIMNKCCECSQKG